MHAKNESLVTLCKTTSAKENYNITQINVTDKVKFLSTFNFYCKMLETLL
jgi:hypothetical protein